MTYKLHRELVDGKVIRLSLGVASDGSDLAAVVTDHVYFRRKAM